MNNLNTTKKDIIRQLFLTQDMSVNEIANSMGEMYQSVYKSLNRDGLIQKQFKPIDWDSIPELGRMKDKRVAKKYKVSESAVAYARKRRGIKAWSKIKEWKRKK